MITESMKKFLNEFSTIINDSKMNRDTKMGYLYAASKMVDYPSVPSHLVTEDAIAFIDNSLKSL